MTDLLTPASIGRRIEVAGPADTSSYATTSVTTTLPQRPGNSGAQQQRRVLRRVTRNDLMTTVGAGISAVSITMLLFGRLTPLSGKLGFLAVAFLIFLIEYGVLLALTEERPAVVDKVMSALLSSAAVLALFALSSVIVFTISKGWSALFKPNLYLEDLSSTGPLDGLDQGGISHAIVGTLVMTALTLVFTVPLGVACAVFLNESRSRGAGLVRTIVTAMTAFPSILAGLFVFATFILILGFERSGLAASIAMSIMMLPIIIRSADVVLRLVPGNLREAAAALGAPHWRTVWHVVLPTARSGLTTSVILGVARGVGETAPVLLTAGVTATMNYNPLKGPMASLPLAAFELIKSPQQSQVARGFATAAVLLTLVLVMFSIARIVGGRPAGRLSTRQARRAEARSARDRQRIDGRTSEGQAVPA